MRSSEDDSFSPGLQSILTSVCNTESIIQTEWCTLQIIHSLTWERVCKHYLRDCRYCSRSPFFISSSTTITWWKKRKKLNSQVWFVGARNRFEVITGSPTVTTPWSLRTLGWWNCPMMAASCKNFTFSVSSASSVNVFTAISFGPAGEYHSPLLTCPNWPDPRWLINLHKS